MYVESCTFTHSYSTFLRELKKVGLKPHDLRKLCATELKRQGMSDIDLMKAMGWESITTAKAYLIPLEEAAMEEKFKMLKGA